MPGMMDTVLNLGLNDESVEGLAARTGNPRFAYDSYRRFIQMFGDVVAEVVIAAACLTHDLGMSIHRTDHEVYSLFLAADRMPLLLEGIYEERRGEAFPQEPRAQLDAAVRAVFESWDNRRARDYRRLNRIPHDLGTAVNVQQMVFGNTGDRSATKRDRMPLHERPVFRRKAPIRDLPEHVAMLPGNADHVRLAQPSRGFD